MKLMDQWYPVKEEYVESSSSQSNYSSGIMVAPPLAVAMEGLNDTGPPPFLTKTFDMVDDPTTAGVVSWSRGGESIVVWDDQAFSSHLLPRHFKHSNFSSFIRQLNTYGFRKIDPDRWEFANELFLKGHKHLLKNITRRKSTTSSPHQQALSGTCVEVGRFEPENEVDRLRRDKHVLFMELVKLRQQQKDTRAYLQTVELQLQGTEKRQQHMMSFLAKAMQNPEFVQQLVQYKEKKKQLEKSVTNKRRRPIDQEGPSTLDFGNLNYGYNQESELETLALEIQGFRRPKRVQDEEEVFDKSGVEDGGFWDELLGNEEQVFDELETLVELDDVEEDVNVLAHRLGFLGSSLK